MNRDILRQVAVIITFIGTVTVNTLATTVELNGYSTGELSDLYVNFITPPGYVFSIWSLIYLGLAAFTVYQALPAQRTNPLLGAVGWLFVLSNILNGAWILVWHNRFVFLSWVVMVALLVVLLRIYTALGTGRTRSPSAQFTWLARVPFSIYTGWITVATIVNTTVLLQEWGFNGGPIAEPIWAAVVLVVGAIIGGYVTFTRRDVAYGGVIIWAYSGIVVKYLATGPAAAYTAGAMAAVVLVILIASLIVKRPPSGRLQSGMA